MSGSSKQEVTPYEDARLEMSEMELQIQAQEHVYMQSLLKEKSIVTRHMLEEVGRSLNAIAQRRRQYFLDYKECKSIGLVKRWHAWEVKELLLTAAEQIFTNMRHSKDLLRFFAKFWNESSIFDLCCFVLLQTLLMSERNLETNTVEIRSENAASRGVKVFLQRVDFYNTLRSRFEDYVLRPLILYFSTSYSNNVELEEIKRKMNTLKNKCENLLSEDEEVNLENKNHSDSEKRFPVISVLRRVHSMINEMVILSFQWRIHARYEQQFERMTDTRNMLDSEEDVNVRRLELQNLDQEIRKTRRNLEVIESEIEHAQETINVSNFAVAYEKCVLKMEKARSEIEECKASIQATDTTIRNAQQNYKKYKTAGIKNKQKLESSLVRKSKKMEELSKKKDEMSKLEEEKDHLDREELSWIRGGYEVAVSEVEALKRQLTSLQENLETLENQRRDRKEALREVMNQRLMLDSSFNELIHKYEYAKRLTKIIVRNLRSHPERILLVKPNKMSREKVEKEGAYVMLQPKGVAMVIHNNLVKKVKYPSQRMAARHREDLGSMLGDICGQFGYYVIHRTDLSTSGIRQHMVGLSDQYHGYQGDHNSLLVIVTAKSNVKGQLLDDEGGLLSVHELLDHFAQGRCPALIGRPKVFIFFLKVTSKKSVWGGMKNQVTNYENLHTTSESEVGVFEPESVVLDEDYLVVRVLFEEEGEFADAPTFGNPSSGSAITTHEDNVPWYASKFIKILSDQAGSKDVLSILQNINIELLKQEANVSSSRDTNESARGFADAAGHVRLFIDHKLTKPLYIMPGL